MTALSAGSPTGRRRLAGVRAQGNGAAFESWLARFIFAPMITREKVLRIDKLSPETRSAWDAGRSRAIFVPVATSGADFVLLLPGGRYGVVECKSTTESRFHRADIPAHQIAHLDAATAAGGGAYLALQFRDGPTSTAFLLPWSAIPWSVARTSSSVIAADLAPWALRNWIDGARILAGGQ